ncbi:MAG TPA: alpha/beta hydrolase [Burkholderiales bacterium]
MASTSPLPQGRWIDVDGIRTRYFEAGSGEPIVFIYGGNFGTGDSASSAYTWSKQIGPLSESFRAITFDKLGQGETDNPKNDDYTMAAVVRHAAAFIRAMKLPPVHLVGHSRGGYAATRLTLDNHDLVRSLTVVNSGTLMPGVGTNEVVLAKPPYPTGTREGVRWVYENYSFDPKVVTEEWVDAVMATLALPKYQESVRKMTVEKLGSKLFAPELAREKRETLQWIDEGRLQRPVQVIWGYDDRTAAVDYGIQLYRMLARHERRALFHVINQSGHFPFREHPERFNALMRRWVPACQE